jgi:hypothetical protein
MVSGIMILIMAFQNGLVAQDTINPSLPINQSKLRAVEITGNKNASYLLIPEFSTVKVMPEMYPFQGLPGEPLRIALARREYEAGQVIVAPISQSLQNVRFQASEFTSPEGNTFPEGSIELSVVGYVQTDSTKKMSYPVDRFGWFPDPILPDLKEFDVPVNNVQTLWLEVHAQENQPPGTYYGEIKVSPENSPQRSLKTEITVFDFALPAIKSFPTIVGVFPEHLEKIYGKQWNEALWWEYAEFMLRHGLDMDNPYREEGSPPGLDRINRLAASGQRRWCLYYIRQPGRGWSSTGPDASEYDDYIERVIHQARQRLEVLEKAGLREMAYIYLFDEVREQHWDKLKEVARRIRSEFPGVPIISSAFDPNLGKSSGLDAVIDEWVQILAFFNRPETRDKINSAMDSGETVHWYTTIWPPRPYPNFFIEYDAIEARLLMGAMAQKYKPDGFGYWAITFWFSTDGQKLLEGGPYTSWNPLTFGSSNGEGSWIYAGKNGPITSLRFENFRDGLEDYEYHELLLTAIESASKRGISDERLEYPRSLLQVPNYIVRNLTDFTREADVLEHHRLQIARAIERLGF